MDAILRKKIPVILWGALASFVIGLAVSVGLQSLLIWSGNLFLAEYNIGIISTTIIGLIGISPLLIGAIFSDDFSVFTMGMVFALLAIIGIYISIVWYFSWIAFAASLAVLLYGLYKMDCAGAEKVLLHGFLGTCLFYCMGAYYAMLINGLAPAIDIVGMTILAAVVVGIWFKPYVSNLY